MYVQLRLIVFFCLAEGNNFSEDVIYFKFRFWPSLLTKGVKNERENAYPFFVRTTVATDSITVDLGVLLNIMCDV